ncbi:MAG TPA: hypothetical protein VF272_00370 [Candidatus Saccharimonadia bacterium]
MTSTQTQGAKQMFDNAVAMQSTQPEAAASIFGSIGENVEGPLGQAAREQLISTLCALGRSDQALRASAKLMQEIRDNSKQSYFWARVAVRWAELSIANGRESDASQVLEQAERIFELNGDYHYVGKVAELKAAISTAKGDYDKADIQAKRGQRLTVTHAPAVTPGRTSSAPELAGIVSSSNN